MIVSNANDNTMYGREQTLFNCSVRAITKFGHNVVNLPDYNGQVDGEISFTVPRSGDLVMGAWFHCVIPGLSGGQYCDGIGYHLIKKAVLEIGGTNICECWGEMLKIWDELTCKPGRRFGQDQLTGSGSIDRSKRARRIIVALDALTFFNHQPCLALPLVSIPFHTTKIRIHLNNLVDGIKDLAASTVHVREGQSVTDYLNQKDWTATAADSTTGAQITTATRNSSQALDLRPHVTVKYVLLDQEERSAFAKKTSSYLIQQWQRQTMKSITSTNIYKDEINLSHPMSSMFWVVRNIQNSVGKNDPFNFMGKADVDNTFLPPIVQYNLYFNNSPIFEQAGVGNQDESWFSVVNNMNFENVPHNDHQCKFINSYSASLDPQNSVQHAGSLNLSRIDTVHMYAQPQKDFLGANENGEMLVFVRSYNVLRVQNGMAGLEYQL
jgi:hypothetical protein